MISNNKFNNQVKILLLSFLVFSCGEKTEKEESSKSSDQYVQEITLDGFNINITTEIKYIDSLVYYKISIEDIDDLILEDQDYFDKFDDSKFVFHFKEIDGFTLYEFILDVWNDENKTNMINNSDDDKIHYFLFESSFPLSLEKFIEINSVRISLRTNK